MEKIESQNIETVGLATKLRWSKGDDYHDKLTEGIYAASA